PVIAWKLLVSSHRGLFFTSPVLSLSVLGFWWMGARSQRRPEAVLCAGMFVVYWMVNASFNGWHGGDTFAPRYLVPPLPFLTLPLTLVYVRLRQIAGLLTVYSAAIMLLATIVTPLPPPNEKNPVWNFLVPLALNRSNEQAGVDRFKGPMSASQ